VLTAAIGAAIGEQVTLMRAVGIAFIFCGVFMVSRS
jgi:drug/metabolite transporter (DMT)-like permease